MPSKKISPLQDRHVLLVDDESMVLMLVEEMLRDLGAASVITAMDIDEAEKIAQTAQLDLAVLDMNLAGRHVQSVAARLRARRIPVVFATETRGAALEDAVILTKPFAQQDLLQAVERVFQTST